MLEAERRNPEVVEEAFTVSSVRRQWAVPLNGLANLYVMIGRCEIGAEESAAREEDFELS